MSDNRLTALDASFLEVESPNGPYACRLGGVVQATDRPLAAGL